MSYPNQPRINKVDCLSNRLLEDVIGDVITSKDFGGQSDGVTNDTTAINLGIAALSALGKSAVMFLPRNTVYTVNSLAMNTNVALIDLSDPGNVKFLFNEEPIGPATQGGIVIKTVGVNGILMRVEDGGVEGDPYLDILNENTGNLAGVSFAKCRLTGTIGITESATTPNAPPANAAYIFTRDNGSGKTELCVRFNTGAVQVLSTEP